MLFAVSCTSHQVVHNEQQALPPLSEPKKSQSATNDLEQCQQLSEGIFVVQAGAFTNISYAQALRKKLEKKGYNTYITLSGLKEDKRLYKVCIGRFIDKQKAEKLSEEIKRTENLDVVVALKPPKNKFVVQAGCFKNMHDAQVLREKLAKKGYNAYITLSEIGKDKKLFIVLIGEFLDREKAEKLSEEIRKKEDIQSFVNSR